MSDRQDEALEYEREARRLEAIADELRAAARALRHAALIARGEQRNPRIGRAPARKTRRA